MIIIYAKDLKVGIGATLPCFDRVLFGCKNQFTTREKRFERHKPKINNGVMRFYHNGITEKSLQDPK